MAQQPAAGTLGITWVTAREVSGTNGGTLASASSSKTVNTSQAVQQVPRLIAEAKLNSAGATGVGGNSMAVWFDDATGYPGSSGVEYVPALITTVRSNTSKSTFTRQSDQGSSLRRLDLNTVTDDGVGGFGLPELGAVNYAGKSINLRLVSQGAVSQGYRSDQETASAFYTSSASVAAG